MRTSVLWTFLVVACVIPIGARQAPLSDPGIGAISGVVVDATTGTPVAGAVVSLGRLDVAAQVSPQPRFVTDARGRFVFSRLPASPSYYLGARRFGYTYTRYGWTAPNGSLATRDIAQIAVRSDEWISDIKIPLWRLGAIEGRVVDESNEPVVGVAVRAFTAGTVAGQRQWVAGPIAVTDDRGVYRLSDLEPARYVVAVLSVQSTVPNTTPEARQTLATGELATGGIGAGRGSTVSAPGIDVDGRHRLVLTNFATPPPPALGQARGYPPTYFPGVRSMTDAEPIVIAYGDSRNGVDLQLSPVPVGRVSGRVESPTGNPAPFLRLMPAGSEQLGFGAEAATTLVERDGTFTFLHVPEGRYTLMAQASVMDFTTGSPFIRFADAPGFPGGGISVGSLPGAPGLEYLARNGALSQLWARVPLTVGRAGLEGVIVQLHQTVTVRGRIVFAEGTPAPTSAQALELIAQPANGDPSLGQLFGRTEPNDSSFPFSIPGLLGGTYLLDSGFTSYSISSVMSGGREIGETGVDAASGRDVDDLIVTLTNKSGAVSGVVRAGGNPTVAAVLIFPVNPDRWVNFGWRPTRFQTTRSGSDGSFRLQKLPEGDYNVIALDPSRINAWTDPVFLAAAAPLATRVSLKWGESKMQDLSLVQVRIK